MNSRNLSQGRSYKTNTVKDLRNLPKKKPDLSPPSLQKKASQTIE